MKVEIITGDAWYKDEVGNTFEVKEQTTFFRQPDGGPRVEHYIVHEENPEKVAGMTRERLIECTHAKVV